MEEIQKDSSGICPHLNAFSDLYKDIHGYLSLTVCFIGIMFNISNFVVFGQKGTIGSPMNCILLAINLADMLLMVEYIPYCIHEYLWTYINNSERYSWSWAAFVWFHANFSIFINTINIFLNICLVVWWFIVIRFHSVHCTIGRCHLLIGFAYIVPIFLSIPNMMALAIKPRFNETNSKMTMAIEATGKRFELEGTEQYIIGHSCLAKANNYFLSRLNIWIYSFLLKVVPCIVLTIFTGFLIMELFKSKQRSVRFSSWRQTDWQNRLNKKQDTTTRILIVTIILFLIAEFPSGIMGVLWAIHGNDFYHDCYHPLGELLDMMALIKSAVSFIPYSLISTHFRKPFAKCLFDMKESTYPMRQHASYYKRGQQCSHTEMQNEKQKEGSMLVMPRDGIAFSNTTTKFADKKVHPGFETQESLLLSISCEKRHAIQTRKRAIVRQLRQETQEPSEAMNAVDEERPILNESDFGESGYIGVYADVKLQVQGRTMERGLNSDVGDRFIPVVSKAHSMRVTSDCSIVLEENFESANLRPTERTKDLDRLIENVPEGTRRSQKRYTNTMAKQIIVILTTPDGASHKFENI